MFDFFKSRSAGSKGSDRVFASDRDSCIQCTEDASVIVINFDFGGWTIDPGGNGATIEVAPPGGIENFDESELRSQVDKTLRGVSSGLKIDQMLRHGLANDSTFVMLLPPAGDARYYLYEAFEKFLKRKYRSSTKDIEAIKLYSTVARKGVHRGIRKMKGKNGPQVIFNLTRESFKYFRYWTDDKDDVSIDRIVSEWGEGRSEMIRQVQAAIRSMDPAYFGRLREANSNGMLTVLLPRMDIHRKAILNAAQDVLGVAPGGAPIQLSGPGVIHLYRGRGNRA